MVVEAPFFISFFFKSPGCEVPSLPKTPLERSFHRIFFFFLVSRETSGYYPNLKLPKPKAPSRFSNF